MSIALIRSELETRLSAWANSFNPVIPVAWEGIDFQIPSSGVYVEPFILPATTINPTVDGGRKRYTGYFQVNIHVKDNSGTKKLNELSDSLVNYFPIVPKTGNVSIERTPSIGRGITDNGWRIVPVSIPYRMET